MSRGCLAGLALLGSLFLAFGQKQNLDRPATVEPVRGEAEARRLIEEILAQRPEEAPTRGTLTIRDAERNERSFPLRMDISQTASNWTHIYQTGGTKPGAGEKLTIKHLFGKSNEYLLSHAGTAEPVDLAGNQTMVPFAGSDFWVVDLGLEFLHWPKQRVVRKEMRYRKSCVMLESINPTPAGSGYARVECWLTIESPHAPVLAKAYDSSGKQIKEFTPEEVERVDGRYQLRSIEMRNLKAKTRSLIEFDLH